MRNETAALRNSGTPELHADPVDAPRCHHGEGPVWDDRRGVLHWVDLTAGIVHHRDHDGGISSDLYSGEITAIAPHERGGLVATTTVGFAHLGAQHIRPLTQVLLAGGERRMNDGGCDDAGRFIAGAMSRAAAPGQGTLFSLDIDGTARILLDAVTIPNGLDWSPDGSHFYFTDSAARTVQVFDYDQLTGEIGDSYTVLDFTGDEGEPDGLTVDSRGNLWVAMWDGWQVRCYTSDGVQLWTLPLPVQRPTSVAFGGRDLRDLFITTSQFGLGPDELADQPDAGRLFCSPSAPVPGRRARVCRVKLPDWLSQQ